MTLSYMYSWYSFICKLFSTILTFYTVTLHIITTNMHIQHLLFLGNIFTIFTTILSVPKPISPFTHGNFHHLICSLLICTPSTLLFANHFPHFSQSTLILRTLLPPMCTLNIYYFKEILSQSSQQFFRC